MSGALSCFTRFVKKRSASPFPSSIVSPIPTRAGRRCLASTVIAVALAIVAASCGSAGEPSETTGSSTSADATVTTGPEDNLVEDETIDEVESGEVALAETLFPDVLAAEATTTDGTSFNFSATLSSTYDSPERYADAWRVLGPDGTEYGIRVLTCLLYTSPSPRDRTRSRMPSSA